MSFRALFPRKKVGLVEIRGRAIHVLEQVAGRRSTCKGRNILPCIWRPKAENGQTPMRVAFFYFHHFPGNSSIASPRPLDWQPSSSRANCALERTRCGVLLGLDLTTQCDRLRNQQSGTGLI